MKKLALLSFLAPLAVFAEEAAQTAQVASASFSGIAYLGFGLAVIGSGIGIGLIGFSIAAAIGRNPSAKADITSGALLPMVLAEGLGIIAVILVFVK